MSAPVQLLGPGLLWPVYLGWPHLSIGSGYNRSTAGVIDASGERFACIGNLHWEGRPTSAKTVSSSGGKVHFGTGNVTFAGTGTPNSTCRVGLQSIAASAGPASKPSDTWDVYRDIVAVTDASILSSSSDNTIVTVPMANGSKSISHGDVVAVVFDFSTRQGSDSIVIAYVTGSSGMSGMFPHTVADTTGSWANTSTPQNICVAVEADDGTIGTIMGCLPCAGVSTVNPTSSSSPDEYGMLFSLPFACEVEQLFNVFQAQASNSDWDVSVYTTPLGTPAAMSGFPISFTAAASGGSTGSSRGPQWIHLGNSPLRLAANTQYCLAFTATGGGQIVTCNWSVVDAAHKRAIGLDTVSWASRKRSGGGAFTETATTIPMMGLGLSKIFAAAGPRGHMGV